MVQKPNSLKKKEINIMRQPPRHIDVRFILEPLMCELPHPVALGPVAQGLVCVPAVVNPARSICVSHQEHLGDWSVENSRDDDASWCFVGSQILS